jgi:heavy metal sensor kinase
MKFLHSIKFRFTLWYLLVLTILLILLGTGIYLNLARTLNDDLNNTLKARVEQLSSFRGIVGRIDRDRFEENIGEIIEFYFYSDNKLDHISPGNIALSISDETIKKVIAGEKILTTIETSGGKRLRVFGTPYLLRPPPPMQEPPRQDDRMRKRPRDEHRRQGDMRRNHPSLKHRRADFPGQGSHPAALFVARDTESIVNAMDGLLWTLLIAIPITLLIAGGGGIFLAGRSLAPVDQITRAAREIEESDLSKRIDVHTKDELGGLAKTLNQMIERLERAFKRQKQFTGDASHELRAPLAVIEAEATLSLQKERNADEYKRSIGTVAAEAQHMSNIIDQLLNLARADAGGETLPFKQVELEGLLRNLCSSGESKCGDKGIDLQLNILNDASVSGDEAMLKRLFSNVLDNAIKYTPEGGKITVLLCREGKDAVIHITDTGIGIPKPDLPHIFDRFYRVDKARSRAEGGSGLGLSICKQITEVHGGSISAESEVGRGSTFTVKLS